MHLARDLKAKKKSYKYIWSRRITQESAALLLIEEGTLKMVDVEKAEVYFF